jgi:2-hydroxy-3-oxopropionate reductase
MKIGFVGLGIMGKPMAKNLIKSGHELLVYDLLEKHVQDVVKAGAKAASVTEIGLECPIMITMLPNSPHVKRVVCGRGGLLESAKQGAILIDMSSIAPSASQEIEKQCAEKGVLMLDAPVSGGEPKAVDGTVAIMVGGDAAVFERVKDDILLKMGASAVHCGPIGAGNTTKLANQIIVACNIAACAEAFTLVAKAGLDPNIVLNAIKGGLAGSTVMNAKVPMMIANHFVPGFKIDLHIKDLDNSLSAGHELGSPMPLTAQVMEMMQTLRADGCGQDDHSSLANYYAKVSGKRIGHAG